MKNLKRISRYDFYLGVLKLLEKRASCLRLGVGAIAIRDGRIIATSYNGPPSGRHHCSPNTCNLELSCERSVHAEQNLVSFCAKEGISLKGCNILISYSPCINCAKLLVALDINRVYYVNNFRDDNGILYLLANQIQCLKFEPDVFQD